jgi:ribosome-binding factor A
MDERRTARVGEALREELLELIGFEMADPRLRGVEITGVEITPDGRHAHVKFTASGDEREHRAAQQALEHAAGFLRHEIAARLELRRVPELHFVADKYPDADSRLDILLKRARKSRGTE